MLAKIESAESVGHLEEILDAVDGAMVARGDLGAELPVEEVHSSPPPPPPFQTTFFHFPVDFMAAVRHLFDKSRQLVKRLSRWLPPPPLPLFTQTVPESSKTSCVAGSLSHD